MCDLLTAAGRLPAKCSVESPIAGIEANQDRDAGFRAGPGEKCPNIDSSLQSYNNNDIGTAASQVNDAIVGQSRPGGSLCRQQQLRCRCCERDQGQQRRGQDPGRGFRFRPAENAALAAGTIDALVVQNPYFLGYQGVIEAAMSTQGRIPPASLDPGVAIADKDNMNEPEVKSLLEPPTAQVGG